MNGTIVARVRRVIHGHSERTLIHAVSDEGLEPKIEVPSDAVRDIVPGQELTLTLTWTLQPAATSVSAPSAPTPLPSAVDEEFMALMARRRGAAPTPALAPTGQGPPSVTGPPLSAAEELARRLGIRPARTTS